jgi:hypothetical protein
MTRDQFELITECLHVANAPAHVQDQSSPTYNKLHKIKWMLDEIWDRFKAMWSPNQQMTVDERMIMYKGVYCPIRQYMPRKPIRFGLKVWAAANTLSKYLWNFEVYCGKSRNLHDNEGMQNSSDNDGNTLEDVMAEKAGSRTGFNGRNVAKDLLKDSGGRGHIVTLNNYFTLVPFFLDLLETKTMATGTLRVNRKYMPKSLFARKTTKNKNIGWINYRMHDEGHVCYAVWKNKKPVIMLSTHATPIATEGPHLFIWQKFKTGWKKSLVDQCICSTHRTCVVWTPQIKSMVSTRASHGPTSGGTVCSFTCWILLLQTCRLYTLI